ncbi:MAG: hypothetical protein RIT45_726 [Pseudomonadota bacterium]|jgi:guanine deaminase
MRAAGTPTAPGGSGQVRGVVVMPELTGHSRLLEDAVVRWEDGRIVEVRAARDGDPPTSGWLISPGFVDLHVHWPQSHVRGCYGGALLPWLREHIWPAEAEFVDAEVAERRGMDFLDRLHAAGTTAALTFGPPFLEASRSLLRAAPRGFFDGPALMECNSMPELERPVPETLAEIAGLPDHERARVVVSPRFAPNLSAESLAACGELAWRLRMPAQSHLSENQEELRWVDSLFPDALDYTDVYDRARLLGPHVVMAHVIYLGARDFLRIAETGTMIAHCPTSNEALESGRMPLELVRKTGARWCLATDVGAGPQLSQVHVIGCALRVHREAGVPIDAGEAWARASAVPGAFLAGFDRGLRGLGSLAAGAPANLVAFALPSGDPAVGRDLEATLEAVVAAHGPDYEGAPRAVWSWGYKLPSSRAFSGPVSSTAS